MDSVEVEYEGVRFTVTGSYERYIPGVNYTRNGDPGDPPEGGCWDEWNIYIGTENVSELLNDKAIDAILDLAKAEMEGW